ncbi:hypothetical protein PAQU9191_01808 [Photobacterium aquimaris]|uniref:Uncharacterized protein n=1 Tax=Photobacterium aquimaris TaxID=512643 RepID=A0A1Y6KX04_9GAMM|nr:hypothetical protein PAQU9191_01808 [Photobacterium aquimaris]
MAFLLFLFNVATRHSPLATRHSPLATRHSPLATSILTTSILTTSILTTSILTTSILTTSILTTSISKRFAGKSVSKITFLSLFLGLKAIILTAYIFHYGEFFAAVYYSYRNVSIAFPVNYKHQFQDR